MKIALVQPFGHFPGHHSYYTRSLATALCSLGHEVIVILHHALIEPWPKDAQLEVCCYAESRPASKHANRAAQAASTNGFALAESVRATADKLLFYRFVRHVSRRERVDVTHYIDFGAPALAVARLLARQTTAEFFTIPTSHYVTAPLKNLHKPTQFVGLLAVLHILAFGKTIFHSEQLRSRLRRLSLKGSSAYIPWGIESRNQTMPKKLAREQLGISEDAYVAIFFGQLRRDKGVALITEMIERDLLAPEVTLAIAGPVMDRDHDAQMLVDRLRKQSSRNIWAKLGYMPDEDVDVLFSAGDVVLLPYDSSFVFASGVLSVATSYKLPVLTSEYGQLVEFVARHQIGRSFSPYSADALARALTGMGAEASARPLAYRPQIERFVREHSWDAIAQRHVEFYQTA